MIRKLEKRVQKFWTNVYSVSNKSCNSFVQPCTTKVCQQKFVSFFYSFRKKPYFSNKAFFVKAGKKQ